MTKNRKLALYVSDDLRAVLEPRGLEPGGGEGLASCVARAVDRYAAICERSLPSFSDEEWRLILDAMNGCWVSGAATTIRGVIKLQIYDAIKLDKLDEKWRVDAPILLEVVDALSFAQEVAIVDACERWWLRVSRGEDSPPLPNAWRAERRAA